MYENRGLLVGLGVGPGDPELITIKAMRAMEEADRLILPQENPKEARAYLIASQALPSLKDKPMLGFSFPMIRDAQKREAQILANYQSLRPYLERGEKLVFLTIGDPCIYSTFFYLLKYVKKDGFKSQIINGVPSFCAAAARFQIPLCLDQEEVHIFSGSRFEKEQLALSGSKILMKSGKQMSRLKEILSQAKEEGEGSFSFYGIKDCGLPQEELYWDVADLPEEYMLTLILRSDRSDPIPPEKSPGNPEP